VTADVLRVKERPISCPGERHEGIRGETISSAQEGNEQSASLPGHFNHGERAPGYRFNKRLGGPQTPF
jgi:hypothetical protein